MDAINWPLICHILQWVASAVVVPLLGAFIKSERLALDNGTKANGLYHGYVLAKEALATIPPDEIKAAELKIDAAVPGVSQVVEEIASPNASAPKGA